MLDAREIHFAGNMLHQYFAHRIAAEGRLPHQHFVEDHSHRVLGQVVKEDDG